ncbi:MAG: hypothetical protein U0M05_05515 [Clostridia bacterium]|nr:hypothetical protein [Clostridia bacterium]
MATMATTVKMCDVNGHIASIVFMLLNEGVSLKDNCFGKKIIVTDIEPTNLVYPEGWYYAKGCFRNKHTSTTGMYEEIPMLKSTGESWEKIARYCTRD